MTTERPVVRCLIARLLPYGRTGKPRLVDLGTAYLAQQSGIYAVIGPDPEDWQRLDAWRKEHEPETPFNQPRMP